MDEYIKEVRELGITEEAFIAETTARLTDVMLAMHKVGNAAKGWTPDRTHNALYNALKAFKNPIA